MMRLFFLGLSLWVTNLYAVNVRIQLAPIDEIIAVSDLYLNQVQVKVQCVFEAANSEVKIRERYVLTRLDRTSEGQYRLRTGKANLNAWLPEYDLRQCRYDLIVLGEDFDGNGLIGDITLLDKGLTHSRSVERIQSRLRRLLLAKVGDGEKAVVKDINHL